jgi:hypothetical protein
VTVTVVSIVGQRVPVNIHDHRYSVEVALRPSSRENLQIAA